MCIADVKTHAYIGTPPQAMHHLQQNALVDM